MEKVQLILQLLHPYTFIPTSMVIREMRVVTFKFAIMLNSFSICCEGKSPPSSAIQVPGLNPGFRSRRYSSTFEPSVTYMDDTLQASKLVLFKVLSILKKK